MRVLVKKNKEWVSLSVSSTSFVNSEDLMKQMHRFVLGNGTIKNMYVDFENTRVPVSKAEEIRIVAQLAAAYHNSALECVLKGEKDLHGNSYTPNVWPEPQALFSDKEKFETDAKGQGYWTQICKKRYAKPLKHNTTHSKEDSWDEELYGERVVYDESFEMNEDLVPWKTNKRWEEKFGYYI